MNRWSLISILSLSIACPLALAAVSIAVPHLHTALYAEEIRVYYVLLLSAGDGIARSGRLLVK